VEDLDVIISSGRSHFSNDDNRSTASTGTGTEAMTQTTNTEQDSGFGTGNSAPILRKSFIKLPSEEDDLGDIIPDNTDPLDSITSVQQQQPNSHSYSVDGWSSKSVASEGSAGDEYEV
jgi:hypothetical protein